MKSQKMVVCLTGGIASGKTAVSDFWVSQGIEVVDTDVVSRRVVEPGSQGLNELIAFFGRGILQSDGTLNRKALRAVVFEDEGKRLALNGMIHPLIKNEVEQSLQDVASRLVVVVIPLYSPTIGYSFINRVCLVDCQESTQVSRLKHRDDVSGHLARRMIDAQSSRLERIVWSDDVIVNEADKQALRTRANSLMKFYQGLACGA